MDVINQLPPGLRPWKLMPVTVALTAAAAGASSLAASVSVEKNAFDLARIWDLLPSLRGPLKPRFELGGLEGRAGDEADAFRCLLPPRGFLSTCSAPRAVTGVWGQSREVDTASALACTNGD